MPENVVKYGDVSQRVGVEVIRARGVDVEKLILSADRSGYAAQNAVFLCTATQILLHDPEGSSLLNAGTSTTQ